MSAPRGGQVADLVARWRRADERLYPIVMVDPDRFAQIVTVVRAAADGLASQTCVEDLVEARRRGHALVSQAAETAGVPLGRLGDVGLVADAAFHLRHRELTARQRRRAVIETVTAARARGDAWVVVAELGDQEQPAVQPYERIEMHVADGRGVRGWIDADPNSFTPTYGLEDLQLDRDTGAVLDGRTSNTRSFTTRAQWEAAWVTARGGRHGDGSP